MLVHIVIVLILAGLALWVIGQIPMDATIAKIIRVVVIVAVVLFLLPYLADLFSGWSINPHHGG